MSRRESGFQPFLCPQGPSCLRRRRRGSAFKANAGAAGSHPSSGFRTFHWAGVGAGGACVSHDLHFWVGVLTLNDAANSVRVGQSRCRRPDSARAQIAGGHKYLPPRQDVNAPDLYIPFMAACTYCVLASVAQTAGKRFKPDTMYATVRSPASKLTHVCYSVQGSLIWE